MPTILLIEDDPRIMEMNTIVLAMHGYRVLQAEALAEADAILACEMPDLLVLDIMMPDGSGLDFCARLRLHCDVAVLFLTALGENEDITRGLRTGGDDYLAKPYDMQVFLARVEALLRRGLSRGRQAQAMVLRRSNLVLNIASMRALVDGEDAMLTPREFAILLTLAQHMDTEVTAAQLYESAWGRVAGDDVRAVRTQVSRLRSKLGVEESGRVDIIFERGRGYRLVVRDEP